MKEHKMTDCEIEKIANDIVAKIPTSIFGDKAGELGLRIPSAGCGCDCACDCVCKSKCHNVCKNFSPVSCLCKEFGHNYCQDPTLLKGMKVPASYSHSDCFAGADIKNIPNYNVCRLALRLMANNSVSATPLYSITDVVISIFAWGTAIIRNSGRHWKTWIANTAKISSLNLTLKNINANGYSDADMRSLLLLPGVGISFASKIMFFYSKKNDAFILDKFTNEHLLEILNPLGLTSEICRRLGLRSNSKLNFIKQDIEKQLVLYKLYNEILKEFAKKLNLSSGELVEILLFK